MVCGWGQDWLGRGSDDEVSSLEAERPPNLAEIASYISERLPSRGYFASVSLANADDSFDGQGMPLYRGRMAYARFGGLEPMGR
jgi:hypothetical protein